MKIVNLTPHTLNIQAANGAMVTIPSTGLARCQTVETLVDRYAGIDIFHTTYGEIEGLPNAGEDTIYVVSMLVRQAVPERKDVFSPGTLLRNADGNPIGCVGLIGN